MIQTALSDVMSALDAARRLGINLNHVYVLLRVGRLEGYKVDGKWVVSGQSVMQRMHNRRHMSRRVGNLTLSDRGPDQ